MNNCNCNQNHGAGVAPGPCVSRNCGATKRCGIFNTEVLPVSVGTDAARQPYAPKFGAYHNTIVQYLANGAVYFYDSKGIYTKIVENGNFTSIIDQLNNEITARQNGDEELRQAITQTAELLQTNINQLANKEAEDVNNLQSNINIEVDKREAEDATLLKAIQDENSRAYEAEQALESGKQDTLVSGTNLKTVNGESLLGEGNIDISGGTGGTDFLAKYTLSAPNLGELWYPLPTADAVIIRGNVIEKDDAESGSSVALSAITAATTTTAGVMSAADKAKLDSLSGGGTPENLTWVFGGNDDTPKQVSIVSATFNTAPSLGLSIPYFDYSDNEVKTGNIDVFPFATTDRAGLMSASDKTKLDSLSASTNLTSVPTASYSADNVNLAFGDETVELTPAVGSAEGKVSQAGIMSAFQASQLEALATAYEAEEKGTVLYEGSASVNNIELSESGLSYDHLIIVAQYMGMGSFALEQQVSSVFYPTDSVKAFQMNATDITTGNAPMVQLIQDIWSITDDGMEIELASALKATVNSETSVEPDTTSHFTITKVVGFGKKLAEG